MQARAGKAVLADNFRLLTAAEDAGVIERNARILSGSPTILLSRRGQAVEIGAEKTTAWRDAFLHQTPIFSCCIFESARASPALSRFREVLARVATHAHFRLVYAAACIREDDFRDPRLGITVSSSDPVLCSRLNPPFHQILAHNADYSFWQTDLDVSRERSRSRSRAVRFGGMDLLAYRALLSFWSVAPRRLARGVALILTDNEFVEETAVELGLRGVAVRKLGLPKRGSDAPDSPPLEVLESTLGSAVRDHVARWACPVAAPTTTRLILQAMQSACVQQRSAELSIRGPLRDAIGENSTIVLTNHPGRPEHSAVAAVCRDNGVPVVAFQHGLAREICAAHPVTSAFYENTISDLLFVYNDTAAQVSRTHPFARGDVVTAGVPRRVRNLENRGRRLDRIPDCPPIAYISTTVYRGNFQMWMGTISDREKAELEIGIIEEVLAKLPHRVWFKTYPSERFLDPDPATERARELPNITVFDSAIDARFLLHNFRAIVTSRATSTFAWCLFAGKPLVFIDHPRDYPVSTEMRSLLREAVFFVDASQPDFRARAREILSRPLEELDREWRSKARAQERIRAFISPPGNAGAVAAETIIQRYFVARG